MSSARSYRRRSLMLPWKKERVKDVPYPRS